MMFLGIVVLVATSRYFAAYSDQCYPTVRCRVVTLASCFSRTGVLVGQLDNSSHGNYGMGVMESVHKAT